MKMRETTKEGIYVVVTAFFKANEWVKSAPLWYQSMSEAIEDWENKVAQHHFTWIDYEKKINIVLTNNIYDITIEEHEIGNK